jgi:hypothetical protein
LEGTDREAEGVTMTTAHGEQAPHGQRARRKVGGGQSLSAWKQHLPTWEG